MTTKDQQQLIGKTGLWSIGQGVRVRVNVLDAREVFGRTDIQITPTDGHGERWVNLDAVTLEDK